MELSPFVRGFVPGILIGVFSSMLLFSTLWKVPNIKERQASIFSRIQFSHLEYGSAPKSLSHHRTRKIREIRNAEDECEPSIYLENQPIDNNNSSYLLVVLVHSSPRSMELRNAVRATWLSGHKAQKRYLARFAIGTKDLKPKIVRQLACENKQYGDLLLLPDVKDSVKVQEWSSSAKLLHSFSWTMKNVNFSYILKCTDSTFAMLDLILKDLDLQKKKNKPGDLLWGFFAGGVQAAKEGRLGEKSWFLCSHYLPFPQGGGYVISNDLISLILSLESDLQHYTHDDIGLGVWISPFIGINKVHDVRFNTGYYSRGCNNAYIITHKETVSTMMQKYINLKQTGSICKEEFSSRLSYVYNWTASANRCCVRTAGIP